MKDVFNLERFGRLFKKTILERPIQLLGLTGLILVVDLMIYTIFRHLGMPWDVIQNFAFIFGFVGGGCFLAAFIFNYFTANAAGSSYLTLPASSFEKWLCGVIIIGIFYPLLFLAFFRIMDTAFVQIFHKSLDPKTPYYKEVYESVVVMPLDGFVANKAYMMFVNFTTAMLVGALYFNKAAFIKVALIVCGLIISGSFLNYYMAAAVLNHVDKAIPFYAVFISVGREFGKVILPAFASKAVDICILYILPGVLLLTAYVRLREKEF